ncbi:hypothetical protein OS493_001962 [Desmophyllum pertusum]|uniref:Transmembrane protein n=1 Tax=Desmophyllum pertusum TaxID=174260 RepID=A0A9W9Z7A5_9CNID|nr:hypothetical protein OS493_001962 [Desmophyllum pertusum]
MADQPRENAVAQQENNGFGPLSKPRGRAATIASVVVVILSGVVLVFAVREKESKEGIHFLVFAVALLTLSLVVGELVRRMCPREMEECFLFHFRFRIISQRHCNRRSCFFSDRVLCFVRKLRSLLSPRLRHLVFSELFLGAAVAVPYRASRAFCCRNIGVKRKKKQECR